jgi:O-methyltransferase
MIRLMTTQAERLSKRILYTKGTRLPLARFSGTASSLHWIGKTASWIHEHALSAPTCDTRFALYDAVAGVVGKPLVYLEFGVAGGASLAHWVRSDPDPHALFFGYDTFEGIPEDWGRIPKGSYSTNGQLPEIDDRRLTLVKGFFEDSLPDSLRLVPLDRALVVHLDADLYSSTRFVLDTLDCHFKSGDVLIFDEFACLTSSVHEFRAFYEWQLASGWQTTVIGRTGQHQQVALRLVERAKPLWTLRS